MANKKLMIAILILVGSGQTAPSRSFLLKTAAAGIASTAHSNRIETFAQIAANQTVSIVEGEGVATVRFAADGQIRPIIKIVNLFDEVDDAHGSLPSVNGHALLTLDVSRRSAGVYVVRLRSPETTQPHVMRVVR